MTSENREQLLVNEIATLRGKLETERQLLEAAQDELKRVNDKLNDTNQLIFGLGAFISDMQKKDKDAQRKQALLNSCLAHLFIRHRYPLVTLTNEMIQAVNKQIQAFEIHEANYSVTIEPLKEKGADGPVEAVPS